MNRQEFIGFLRQRLAGLPEEDIQKQCQYYCEMIDDRMEDGMSEEEAIAGIDLPGEETAVKLQPSEPKAAHKSMPVWAIVLLVLGAPVWLSLLIAAASVILSLYVSLWAVLISLYTIPVTLGACAVAGAALAVKHIVTGSAALAMFWLGTGLACAGLCMFSFYLCNLAAKGTVKLTVWSFQKLCAPFKRKEMGL